MKISEKVILLSFIAVIMLIKESCHDYSRRYNRTVKRYSDIFYEYAHKFSVMYVKSTSIKKHFSLLSQQWNIYLII